jgi:alginate O-acetyltransferase complex protein AlgI
LNFVVWGGLHGSVLACERSVQTRAFPFPVGRWLSRLLVFHFVCFTWIFFRAPTIHASITMLSFLREWPWMASYPTAFLYLALAALPLILIDLYLEHSSEEYPAQHASFGWQLMTAATALVVIAFASAYESAPFVYFQF